MIRLIVSDVDGTLVPDSAKYLGSDIFYQIQRLVNQGIIFCPASGRQFTSLRNLFHPLSEQLYFLCENGAAIFGPGVPPKLLSKTTMDRKICLELSHQILDIPEYELIISGQDTTYICPKHPDLEVYIRNQLGNNVKIVSKPEDIPEGFLKVSAYCRLGGKVAEKELAPRWKEKFKIAVAGINWLDFTITDKGEGLKKLCNILGIDMSEVMAFGDNDNDLSMLKLAGHPHIVETASAKLKEQFTNQICCVADILSSL